MQRLFWHQGTLTGLQLAYGAQEPLLQLNLHARLDVLDVGARSEPPDQVQPVLFWKIENAATTVHEGLIGERNPKRRRVLQPVPKETGRRDSDHRERLPVESESSAYNRWILPILLLPGAETHDRNGLGSLVIVRRREHPPGIRTDPEHRKVIS